MGTRGNRNQKRAVRFATATVLVALTITLIAGLVPTGVAAEAATDIPVFQNLLVTDTATAKFDAEADPALVLTVTPHERTATVIQPVVAPRTSVRRTSTTSSSSSGGTATSTGTAVEAAASAPAAPVDETAQAQSILAGLIGQYPILAGSTVSFGDAKGSQAICYYKSGRIVISASHTASLSRILNHEVWHIIDWRDNGVIDWGESVPPQ